MNMNGKLEKLAQANGLLQSVHVHGESDMRAMLSAMLLINEALNMMVEEQDALYEACRRTGDAEDYLHGPAETGPGNQRITAEMLNKQPKMGRDD